MNQERPLPRMPEWQAASLVVVFVVVAALIVWVSWHFGLANLPLLLLIVPLAAIVWHWRFRRCPRCHRRLVLRRDYPAGSGQFRWLLDCLHCQIAWDTGDVGEDLAARSARTSTQAKNAIERIGRLLASRQHLSDLATAVSCSMIAMVLLPLVTTWCMAGFIRLTWMHPRSMGLAWVWFVLTWLIPLIALGVANVIPIPRLLHHPKSGLVLLPSIMSCVIYAPLFGPGFLSMQDWLGASLSLVGACAPPLASIVAYALYRRYSLRTLAEPLQPSNDLSQPKLWLLRGACLLNLLGIWLGNRGVAHLKLVRYPPFNEPSHVIHFISGTIQPPLWLPQFWDWRGGQMVLWAFALFPALFLIEPRGQRRLCRNTWVRNVGIVTVVPGLIGLWIWTHAVVVVGSDTW